MQTVDQPSDHEPASLRVDVHPERTVVRVAPAGELHLGTAELLAQQLRELRESGFEQIVLDLRKLTFVDSTGVALIMAEDRCARGNGHDLTLISGPPPIQRVLELCGVLALLRFNTD